MEISKPTESGASVVSNVIADAAKAEIIIGISPRELWDSIKEVPIDTLFVGSFCLVVGLLLSIGVEKLGRLLYNYIARSILMLFMTISFTAWIMQSPIGQFLIQNVRISTIILALFGVLFNKGTPTVDHVPLVQQQQPTESNADVPN